MGKVPENRSEGKGAQKHFVGEERSRIRALKKTRAGSRAERGGTNSPVSTREGYVRDMGREEKRVPNWGISLARAGAGQPVLGVKQPQLQTPPCPMSGQSCSCWPRHRCPWVPTCLSPTRLPTRCGAAGAVLRGSVQPGAVTFPQVAPLKAASAKDPRGVFGFPVGVPAPGRAQRGGAEGSEAGRAPPMSRPSSSATGRLAPGTRAVIQQFLASAAAG